MIVLKLPVRLEESRDANGVVARRYRLASGFALVENPTENILGNGGDIQISNPLIEYFLNTTQIGVGEPVYIELFEQPHSNPMGVLPGAAIDNQADLTHNDTTVS